MYNLTKKDFPDTKTTEELDTILKMCVVEGEINMNTITDTAHDVVSYIYKKLNPMSVIMDIPPYMVVGMFLELDKKGIDLYVVHEDTYIRV